MDKNQKLVNFMNIMCNQRTKKRRKFVKYKRDRNVFSTLKASLPWTLWHNI